MNNLLILKNVVFFPDYFAAVASEKEADSPCSVFSSFTYLKHCSHLETVWSQGSLLLLVSYAEASLLLLYSINNVLSAT